jgi:hypothetical protein
VLWQFLLELLPKDLVVLLLGKCGTTPQTPETTQQQPEIQRVFIEDRVLNLLSRNLNNNIDDEDENENEDDDSVINEDATRIPNLETSVINIQEKSTATLTFNSGAGTSAVYPASSSAFYSRNNKSVSILFNNSGSGTTGSGSTTISINTATGVVPSRYRPTAASIYCAASCKEGTPGQSSIIGILTTGQIQVYKITEATWSTSVAFVPINGPLGISYTLN